MQQRTTPMAAVKAGNVELVVDCGSGATQRLAQSNISLVNDGAILLTHFHADHCVDFPLLVLSCFLAGRENPLPVYGPKGLQQFVNVMFDELFAYIPNLIENVTGKKPEIETIEVKPGFSTIINNCRITTGKAVHGVPALCLQD